MYLTILDVVKQKFINVLNQQRLLMLCKSTEKIRPPPVFRPEHNVPLLLRKSKEKNMYVTKKHLTSSNPTFIRTNRGQMAGVKN